MSCAWCACLRVGVVNERTPNACRCAIRLGPRSHITASSHARDFPTRAGTKIRTSRSGARTRTASTSLGGSMVACTISRTSSRRHSQSMSFSTMRPTRSSSPTTTCQSGAPRSTVSQSRLELSLQQSKEALPLPPLPQVLVWRVLLRTVQGFDGRDARKAEIGGAGADRQPQGRAADHQGDFG